MNEKFLNKNKRRKYKVKGKSSKATQLHAFNLLWDFSNWTCCFSNKNPFDDASFQFINCLKIQYFKINHMSHNFLFFLKVFQILMRRFLPKWFIQKLQFFFSLRLNIEGI